MDDCQAIREGAQDGPALGPSTKTWHWLAKTQDRERLAWTLFWVYQQDEALSALQRPDDEDGPHAPPEWITQIVTRTAGIVQDKRHLYVSAEIMYWLFKKDFLRPQVAKLVLWTLLIAIIVTRSPDKIMRKPQVQVLLALSGSWSILHHIGKRADLSNVLWTDLSGERAKGEDMFGLSSPCLDGTLFRSHLVFQVGGDSAKTPQDFPSSVQLCLNRECWASQNPVTLPPIADGIINRIRYPFLLAPDASAQDKREQRPELLQSVQPLSQPNSDVADNPLLLDMMRGAALDAGRVAAYLGGPR